MKTYNDEYRHAKNVIQQTFNTTSLDCWFVN